MHSRDKPAASPHRSVDEASRGRRALRSDRTMIIAMTVVLPVPVASFRASRGRPGLDSSFAPSRYAPETFGPPCPDSAPLRQPNNRLDGLHLDRVGHRAFGPGLCGAGLGRSRCVILGSFAPDSTTRSRVPAAPAPVVTFLYNSLSYDRFRPSADSATGTLHRRGHPSPLDAPIHLNTAVCSDIGSVKDRANDWDRVQ